MYKIFENICLKVIVIVVLVVSSLSLTPIKSEAANIKQNETSGIGNISQLSDVVYGNGKFVAIGYKGTIVTSVDGKKWTNVRPYLTDYNWHEIIFADNKFYIIGNHTNDSSQSKVAVSDDGVSWSELYSVSDGSLADITKINGQLIVSQNIYNGYIDFLPNYTIKLHSLNSDGTWTSSVVSWQEKYLKPSAFYATSLEFKDGLYVLGLSFGGYRALTSTNLVDWTPVYLIGYESQGGNSNFLDIVDGKFVFGFADGKNFTSGDGSNWNLNTNTTYAVEFIKFKNKIISSKLAYSSSFTDTFTEVAYAPTAITVSAMAHNNDIAVAVGNSGLMLYSEDGMNWKSANFNFKDVTYGESMYVVVGDTAGANEGAILTSSDFVNWTLRYTIPSKKLTSVTYDGVKFVAVGAGGMNVTSTNGIDWTPTGDTETVQYNSIALGNNKFVKVGSSGKISSSDDGVTWTSTTVPGITSSYNSVKFENNRFVAVTSNKSIVVSENGVDWVKYTIDIAENVNVRDVVYLHGFYYFIGNFSLNSFVIKTRDFLDWSNVSIAGSYQSISTNQNSLSIAGSNSQLANSHDGNVWNSVPVDFNGYSSILSSIKYINGSFRAVGQGQAAITTVILATSPLPPMNVTATAGNGSAVVTFDAPTDTGGSVITSYKVNTYDGTTLVKSETGSSSPITVSGLTNGTGYTFKVVATNAVGDSSESTASPAITPTRPVSGGSSGGGSYTPPTSNTQIIEVDIVNSSDSNTVITKTRIIRKTQNGVITDTVDFTEEEAQRVIEQLEGMPNAIVQIVLPSDVELFETNIHLSKGIITKLVNSKTELAIVSENVQIKIPNASLNNMQDDVNFRIIPVKNGTENILMKAQQNEGIQQRVTNTATITIAGQPMKIETNMQNQPVELILPVPNDAATPLVIYIEHSDGTTEVIDGEIISLSDGKKGVRFEVDHFSTFTMLSLPDSKVEEPTEPEEPIEPEVPSEPEKPEKVVLAAYIQGYEDGTFRPGLAVTRAQIALMMARFLTNDEIPSAANTFVDTKKHGAQDAIEYIKKAGLVKGTSTTSFRPNNSITRAQMAEIAARWITEMCKEDPNKMYCNNSDKGKQFTDVSNNHWAAASINRVSALGIMQGTTNTTFNPSGHLTRAQAVKVLNRLFERQIFENVQTSMFTDISPNHWAIGEIESAASDVTIEQ